MLQKEIPPGLVEPGQPSRKTGSLFHEIGNRQLHRMVDGEHVELVDLAKLSHQALRRQTVADLPPRDVVRLAEAGNHERAFAQFGVASHALVADTAEYHVLIDFVANDHNVGAAHQRVERFKISGTPYRPAGIVRRVDDDHAGPRRNQRLDLIPIRQVIGGAEQGMHHPAAIQFDRRAVSVIDWRENDGLIARPDAGGDGGKDGLGGASGHRDLVLNIIVSAIKRRHLGANGGAQRCHAGHRCVLVLARGHVVGHPLQQTLRRIEVGKSLRQIDRAVLRRQARHDRENSGADPG